MWLSKCCSAPVTGMDAAANIQEPPGCTKCNDRCVPVWTEQEPPIPASHPALRRERVNALNSAVGAVRMAFFEMMHEDGVFGIKPSEHWIRAIWGKDLEPRVRRYFFGTGV